MGAGSRLKKSKSNYAGYIASCARRNQTVLTLAGLFIVGTVLGTILVSISQPDTISMLLHIVDAFVEIRRAMGISEIFFASLPLVLLPLLAIFICGFWAISQPIIISIPLIRGLGFGFSAASLYAGYGASAIIYVAVFILPSMILSTIILLFCAGEALRLSNGIFIMMRSGGSDGLPIRIYCARFLVFAGLCIISAIIEATIFYAFSGMFWLG